MIPVLLQCVQGTPAEMDAVKMKRGIVVRATQFTSSRWACFADLNSLFVFIDHSVLIYS